jgi:hypothetical protein
MEREIRRLRAPLARRESGRGRRFSPELRRQISGVGRRLRSEGASWSGIGAELGLPTATMRRNRTAVDVGCHRTGAHTTRLPTTGTGSRC